MQLEDLEVIIPAYDDGTHLRPLLRELNAQSARQESTLRVLVSDDGSEQPLEQIYRSSLYPDLELRFERGPNSGPGAARNRGLRRSHAMWVAFLDADTVPTDNWLETVRAILTETPDVQAVEGRTRFAGGLPSPFAHATEISAGEAFGGANLIYRRESLIDIGGFDEAFYDKKRRLHFREDADLHFRAVEAGLKIVARPDLVIEHPPLEASIQTPLKLARRYYFDPLLFRKHPEQFRALNSSRPIGPISLRMARHLAAVSHVASTLSLVEVVANHRSQRMRLLTASWFLGSWAANVGALSWKRSVRVRHAGPLLAVSFLTPWVYSWNYYRGVLAFRSRPRLR